jgi:hypothetical protein
MMKKKRRVVSLYPILITVIRRAKFIHQEFRTTGFVSAVQHFVIEGKKPIMVIIYIDI